MDAYDYLLSGVMNGNPAGFEIPNDIETEMSIAMLDVCDDIIDNHRRTNRAFDVGCDPRFGLWDWTDMPFDRIKVGMNVMTTANNSSGNSTVIGKVLEISQPREVRISGLNEPVMMGMTTSVKIELDSSARNAFGDKLTAVFTDCQWSEHGGYILTPVPMDGAPLGKYLTIAK